MGIVYRATQLALNRPVALKLLSPVYAVDDDFRERFKREWETAAAIDHPNVIPLYEAGEAQGHLFLAMRYVSGVDLANLIAREEIAPARAVRLLAQAASALDAAHARGLVHRDVKPANMLVDPGDHVYLTDFGLSRGTAQSRLTRTGLFVGSTDYAAPEQIRGEDTDSRTDVYALGCVLYQLLTRQVPFDRAGDMAKMYAHITDPVPSAAALRGDLPPAIDAVVAKAMAKEADDRYPSAGELARAAVAALGDGSWATTPPPAPAPGESGWNTVPVGVASIPHNSAAVHAGSANGWAAAPAGGAVPVDAAAPAAAEAPNGATASAGPAAPPHNATPAPAPAPPAPPAPPQRPAELSHHGGEGSDPLSGGDSDLARENPWPRRRRVAVGVTVPVVLVAGLAAAALAVIGGGDDGQKAQATPQPTVAATAPPEATATATATPPAQQAPRVTATIDVGDGPDGLDVSGGRVFVANQKGHTLSVIDPETDELTGDELEVGARPDGVVAGKGVVWVAGAGSDAVQRIEAPEGGEPLPTAKVDVGDRPEAIALGKQLVWVANRNSGTVNRIDRATPSVVGSPIGVGAEPSGIFVGLRFVWVANTGEDTITRIDPSTAQVVGQPLPAGSKPRGVIETPNAVWIANSGDKTVSRLDKRTGKPLGDPVPVGNDPRQLAFGFNSVWVTNRGDNTVTRLDEATGKVIGSPVAVGERPLGIATGAGAIWVANHESNTVTRIQP